MPFKVKEYFRKTKKGGLSRVKESTRKDRVKKGLVITGTALTTLGLGALAYKKLGSKLIKTVANKVDDVPLLTPSTLTTNTSKYKTLPDPWLDNIVKGSDKPLTVSKVKEKPLLLNSGYNVPTRPSVISVRRNKGLGGEIRSQRTLIGREPTDILNANKQLELAKRYEVSDSPALQRTGASYRKRAEERLTIIAERSPSKKQTGLITTRGNASQGTTRSSNYQKKVREKKPELTVTKAANTNEGSKLKPEPPISEVTKIPNPPEDTSKLVTSRRTVLRGLLFGAKNAIQQAPKQVADKAKKSLMDTIGDAKWIDDNIQEIGKKGKNVYKRRVVLSKAKNKLINKAGYELNKDKEGLGQAIDIATLPGRARRTNRTIKRQSAVIVKQAKKARAALGDPAAYHELTTGEKLNAGARLIRLLGG